MNLIEELEDQFAAERLTLDKPLQLTTCSGSLTLSGAKSGTDFIAGLANGVLHAIPICKVRSLESGEPPAGEDSTFVSFLASQREPVRVFIESDRGVSAHWLLNLSGPWVRLGCREGTSWHAVSNIELVQVGPVDNQKLTR